MLSPAPHLPTTRVLTAVAGAQLLALPSGATGRIATCRCSPPPPGAAPWLGGVALIGQQVIWAIDPVGLCRSTPATSGERLLVVVQAGGTSAGWGVVISAAATLADATVVGGDVLAGCPGGWLQPALLADGRRAWLVHPTAITNALMSAEAA